MPLASLPRRIGSPIAGLTSTFPPVQFRILRRSSHNLAHKTRKIGAVWRRPSSVASAESKARRASSPIEKPFVQKSILKVIGGITIKNSQRGGYMLFAENRQER